MQQRFATKDGSAICENIALLTVDGRKVKAFQRYSGPRWDVVDGYFYVPASTPNCRVADHPKPVRFERSQADYARSVR